MFKEKQICVKIDGKDIILDITLKSYREYSNSPANIIRTKIIAVHSSTKVFTFLKYLNTMY